MKLPLEHGVNGTCDCKATQYHAAPCAHRLAFRVYQRTVERLTVDLEERWEPVEAPAATPPAPQPLPEAPASCNVYVTIGGHKVQVTLRDTNEHRMLARLQTVLVQYPAPEPQAAPAASQLSPPPHGALAMHRPVQGICPVHNVAMKENHGKDSRSWWSHYDETAGRWCKDK